ncbi:hypothetical protein DSUL_60211 [Desulfovibrionales bacterium]
MVSTKNPPATSNIPKFINNSVLRLTVALKLSESVLCFHQTKDNKLEQHQHPDKSIAPD